MSSKNNNQLNIPEAREAMDQFKMEAGSVGGQMVKKMCPVRTASFERSSRILTEHKQNIQYITSVNI